MQTVIYFRRDKIKWANTEIKPTTDTVLNVNCIAYCVEIAQNVAYVQATIA